MLVPYNELTPQGKKDVHRYASTRIFYFPIDQYAFHCTKSGRLNKSYKWPAVLIEQQLRDAQDE